MRLEPPGLITTGGTLGPIVPPSIALIIYGSVTGTSVGKLFAAALPMIVLMLVALVILTCVPVFSMLLPNTFFQADTFQAHPRTGEATAPTPDQRAWDHVRWFCFGVRRARNPRERVKWRATPAS